MKFSCDTGIINQALFFLADTTIRAIGKRAHPMHSVTFFSSMCVVVSIVG